MTKNQSVTVEVKGKVAIITLNEPDSLNALSEGIKKGLYEKVNYIEENHEISVVVLTGAGRAFCAGGDIRGMGERTTLQSFDRISNTTQIIKQIFNISKPVIAAVNGHAMGAGFSLALSADIIFAQPKAKFGLSFSKIGLLPDCGLLYFLPKIVGPWKTKEWVFNGSVIDAEEAYRHGIVNQLVEEEDVVSYAVSYAENLSESSLQSMRFTKLVLRESQNLSLDATLQYENLSQTILQQTEDYKEGVQAFKEKRKAKFTGK